MEVTQTFLRGASACFIKVQLVGVFVSGFPLANQFCRIGIHIELRLRLGTPHWTIYELLRLWHSSKLGSDVSRFAVEPLTGSARNKQSKAARILSAQTCYVCLILSMADSDGIPGSPNGEKRQRN